MKTTLNKIRAHSPCHDGWKQLLVYLGKAKSDDDPLSIATILNSNGIDDALWCVCAVEGNEREMRLFAVWCARRVEHLMTDPRSRTALDVAERYARGRATDVELQAAAGAAWAAAVAARAAAAVAWASALSALRAAERVAAWATEAAAMRAAIAAAHAAAHDAEEAVSARNAERSAQAEELRRVCTEIEAGRDPYPEEDGR